MPQFKVTDPQSGQSLILTGDSPPSEQELHDIFAHHGAEPPNSAVDAVKSIPGGLAEGVAGMTGDTADFVNHTVSGLIERTTGIPAQKTEAVIRNLLPAMPRSKDAKAALYQPQTPAGEYASTVSSFVPAAVSGGGGALRVGANAVVPGLASETAGQLTKGTSAEPYARAGGAVLGAGAVAAAPTIAGLLGRVANRGYEFVTGNEFLDPETEASRRMASALTRDGGLPEARQNIQNWQGNSDPSLIDVGGNNVRRLVRAAASGAEGDAQNIAQGYQNRVTGNLQDNASTLARRLTPNENRPASIVSEDLEATRGNLANEQYAAPYQQPATVTRDMVSALQGTEGRRAISRAMTAASAQRNEQQMGELRDLLSVASQQSGGRDAITGQFRNLEDALQNLSSGALDRVRIGMRDIGREWYPKSPSVAAGYRGRVSDIDTALDQTPGLQEARGTYRNYSDQISGVELGRGALNTPHDVYSGELGALEARSPDVSRQAAGVGYRQAITDAIERPAAGSTGVLNRLATSTQQGDNLTATFGPEAAGRFQTGIGNEASRVANARFINPNTGSQTALRGDELALVDAIPNAKASVLTSVIGALKNGLSLTPAQRAAIVRMGTTEANLRHIIEAMPQRQAPEIANHLMLAAQLAAPQAAGARQ